MNRLACIFVLLAVGLLATTGCNTSQFLNPALVNQSTGEVFALTPGDRSSFILVRGNNATTVPIEFLITVERQVESADVPGTFTTQTESVRLFAPPNNRANDVGELFDCPVSRVGLGEDLDRPTTEPGIFVNAQAVGVGGLGVPPNVNPLSADADNFKCGDTIIFQVSETNNTVGGVVVQSYVLDSTRISTNVTGFDTFVNARSLLEEQQFAE